MRFLIFTKGPGETSQGYALAKHFTAKGHQIFIGLQQKTNASFFAATEQAAHLFFAPNPPSLIKLVKKISQTGLFSATQKPLIKRVLLKNRPGPKRPPLLSTLIGFSILRYRSSVSSGGPTSIF